MFMNVFAAEMILGISEANLKECLERSQLPEGFKIDDDFQRNYLLFTLLASCCVDYINEMGLQEGDDLHRAIVTKLADLATVYQNGYQPYTYEGFSKAISEGKLPFDRGNLSVGFNGEQFVDMPKQAIDNFARMAEDVIDPSFEAKNWDNYGAVCRMAGEHFTESAKLMSMPKPRVYRDESGRLRFGFAGPAKPPEDIIEDGQHLDFDL